jgi:hypothetical protein
VAHLLNVMLRRLQKHLLPAKREFLSIWVKVVSSANPTPQFPTGLSSQIVIKQTNASFVTMVSFKGLKTALRARSRERMAQIDAANGKLAFLSGYEEGRLTNQSLGFYVNFVFNHD